MVVKVGASAVFLDLDGKREAFIERAALVDADGNALTVNVGDRLSARVAQVRRSNGDVILVPVAVRRPVSETQDDAPAEQVDLVDASGPRLATGLRVKGEVVRVESYGIFVQIAGTTGRSGRGLVPAIETGLAKGTDLRKKIPVGTQVEVKVLAIAEDGKIRLSMRAIEADDERSSFEKYAGGSAEGSSQAGFGTLAAAFARGTSGNRQRKAKR